MMLVSVIIPTLDRAELLLRAVNSVLRQTYREIEIIVVVDRPSPETLAAVQSIADSRLRLLLNPHPTTAAGARNVGADHAAGEWIAFLDDDDEWLPNKLERQLAFAEGSPTALFSCLSRVVTPYVTFVSPKVIFDNSIPVDEYLFNRRSLSAGWSGIQTSSFLLPTKLFERVRFNIDSGHDDWEFVLRLSKEAGARIETVPEVLVVNYFEEARPSFTARSSSWLRSLRWIESMRPILTRRAYSGFCLGAVGSRAAQERAYKAFPYLLHKAFRNGSPGVTQLLPFLAYWLMPLGIQKRIRGIFRSRPRPHSLNKTSGETGRVSA
jgi:glycosyltransferase involved in cell wall biosynthesis